MVTLTRPIVFTAIYDELHRQAARAMRRENEGNTLQATALVHEAYLRLVDQRQVEWRNRAHFFGVAAQMMRRVLVDRARARLATKRGGELQQVTLGDVEAGDAEDISMSLPCMRHSNGSPRCRSGPIG
jgi:RNA polymerase sigma factor (TIGR02999 family)